MSDFNNNSDNQEFIKKLELLRDLEAEKPVEEMDVSLVKACVELILELRGETVNFTPEEVEEKVRKIPFVEETTTLNTPLKSVKGRSTKVKSRKILLIAAIISILIAIFAVTSIAFDWNIFEKLYALKRPTVNSTRSAVRKKTLARAMAEASPRKDTRPSSTRTISYPKFKISLFKIASMPK